MPLFANVWIDFNYASNELDGEWTTHFSGTFGWKYREY